MNQDYYTGYEGYPELRVSLRRGSEVAAAIRVWSGYFNQLMDLLPKCEGKWTGIAKHYHLDTGWYDASPWVDPNAGDSVCQLRYAVARCPDGPPREFGEAWLRLLDEAANDPDSVVTIEYD
jgi:hypothetical protein